MKTLCIDDYSLIWHKIILVATILWQICKG
jgi:hypothetical protein